MGRDAPFPGRGLDRLAGAQLGARAASILHNNYEILADRYGAAEAFPAVIRLMPDELLDSEMIGLLRRKQMHQVLVQKIDRLTALNRQLQDKNVAPVQAQAELKAAETDMRHAKEQVDLANRAKTEFLANVTHQLRTPLNCIIGFSGTLLDDASEAGQEERHQSYARYIHQSGHHLAEIIDDILDVSRIETGNFRLMENRVDVARVIVACESMVTARTAEAGVALTSDIPADLPRLMADERVLKQILVNLLTNAIKFTPSGGWVAVRPGITHSGEYAIAVADSGIGIADEDIPTVLTPFGRVDNSPQRQQDGTGLGLPLVKSLTELHEGTFKLQSKLGAGTTATVYFPRTRIVSE